MFRCWVLSLQLIQVDSLFQFCFSLCKEIKFLSEGTSKPPLLSSYPWHKSKEISIGEFPKQFWETLGKKTKYYLLISCCTKGCLAGWVAMWLHRKVGKYFGKVAGAVQLTVGLDGCVGTAEEKDKEMRKSKRVSWASFFSMENVTG